MARPRLFTIAPGAPFLPTFARALLAGDILPTVSAARGPLALADTTIYVPTRRAARALISQLAGFVDSGAVLLPKIRPLGAVDEEAALFADPLDGAFAFDGELPGAINEIERRLLLAELVSAWSRALAGAIVGAGREGEPSAPLLVGATPADALALAGDLAGLIDEFIVEGADWSAVRSLVAEEYDRYWAISVEFLKIAFERWPAILAERKLLDAADRRARLIEREIARLNAGVNEPTIVLGSTGTNRATARLIGAIARLPAGAVVLPGLDLTAPENDWRAVAGREASKQILFNHPQAALARLLNTIGADRSDVRPLCSPVDALEQRRLFVAQALAPSEGTPAWRSFVATHGAMIEPALRDVALIEAADEREEALAIAIRLRAALETPGATAALITPDRAIARRVRAEFARWRLEVDDSGGEPLGGTPAGAFARAALTAASEKSDVALAALLADPTLAPAQARDRAAALARMFEIGVLRATPHDADWARRIASARIAARDRRAHPAVRRIGDAEWSELREFITAVEAALAPLYETAARRPVATWIRLHQTCLAALAAQAAPRGGDDALALERLFAEVGAAVVENERGFEIDLSDYRALFDTLTSRASVRGPQRSHPRLKILGLLEARLLDVDVVVLAGLDETIWPPQTRTDAFLNRPMRAQLGLTPPERRIGQSAHDLTMAMGAPCVTLARALKRDRAPTVPSRFLQRMEALAGDVWKKVRERGDAWVALAREIDRPSASVSLARPNPAPPLDLRPTALSVTRIETLRRDPYAIFAERILELQPLEALDAVVGAAEQGTAIHAALYEIARRWPQGALPPDARDIVVAAAREQLAEFFADPSWRAFRWPGLLAGVDFALDYDARRRAALARVHGEAKGQVDLELRDGSVFRLSAVADRIEIDLQGRARIVDYKTGAPPTAAQARVGFASQLTLEAEMVRRGGFKEVGDFEPESGLYLKIGGRGGGKIVDIAPKDVSFDQLAGEHWDELAKMLSSYRDPARGYASRPFAQYASRYGDYDHLARVKEWSATGGAQEGEA